MRFFVLSVLVWGSVGMADSNCRPDRLCALEGRWTFDHLNPNQTYCEEIDDRLLQRFARARTVCRLSKEGGYSPRDKGSVYFCEGRRLSRMVVETPAACQDHLETEIANGD